MEHKRCWFKTMNNSDLSLKQEEIFLAVSMLAVSLFTVIVTLTRFLLQNIKGGKIIGNIEETPKTPPPSSKFGDKMICMYFKVKPDGHSFGFPNFNTFEIWKLPLWCPEKSYPT